MLLSEGKKHNRLAFGLTRLGQTKAEFSATTTFAATAPDDADAANAAATTAASASHFSARTEAVNAADDCQRHRQNSEGDDEDDGDDEFELAVRPTQIRRQNVETRLEEI